MGLAVAEEGASRGGFRTKALIRRIRVKQPVIVVGHEHPRVNAPPGLGAHLRHRPHEAGAVRVVPDDRLAPVAAVLPSSLELPGGVVVRVGTAPSGRARYAGRISRRAADLPLRWRPPGPGERWPDASGRPLAWLLAAAGVPPGCRRAWPLLEAGGTILWVPGVGVRAELSGVGEGDPVAELEVPW